MRAKRKMGFEHLQRRDDPWAPRYAPPSAEELAWARYQQSLWEYRITVFGRAVTPWSSKAETHRAAIRMGHASRCEQTRLLFMTVPAELESRKVDPPPKPPHELCCSRRRAR